MDDLFEHWNLLKRLTALSVLVLILLMSIPFASAHGPKGHDGAEFTPLQAVKKGIVLYNKLIASGKLKISWETDLKDIEVFPRQNGEKKEMVVKFSRSKGDPNSVYIFFTENGNYSGSNFTGN